MTKFQITNMKLLYTILALALVTLANCQSLTEKYSGYSEDRFRSMPFGFFKPLNFDPSKSYPLIVYLHGSNDLVSRDLIWYGSQKEYPSFVLTPKCKETNQGWGNTWTDSHT
jgi:predicted peptidase